MLVRDNGYIIKQQLTSYLADFRSKRLSLDGESFSFIEGGRSHSRCIVFLHGAVGNKNQWRGLMQLLSRSYRVIAIDVPGLAVGCTLSGDQYSLTSLSEYLNRFFILKGISSASLVSHSMGANVACRFTALHPNKITSLVVSSLTGWEQLFGQSYWNKFSEFKQLLVFNSLNEFKTLFSSLFYQVPYMPNALLEFRMRDLKKHQTQLFRVLTDIQHEFYTLSDDLKSLSCPVLAINGIDDVFIDMAIIDKVGSLLPEMKVFNLPECGHVPFLEHPKKTHLMIKDFILSCPENTVIHC